MKDKKVYWTEVKTPEKRYVILATEKGVCWAGSSLDEGKKWGHKVFHTDLFVEDVNFPVLKKAAHEFEEFVEGKRKMFSGPFDFYGTEFQKKVWHQLLNIEYGKTKTYGELAKLLGSEKASRAVGAACGANPIGILVPCHRVIGSTGKLTGYAGGLSTKEWLLRLEKGI